MIDLFSVVGPVMRSFPPEVSHTLTIKALATGLSLPYPKVDDPILRSRVCGLDFANPVGLAAGFDKNAEVVDPLLRLGFGFVEVGTVTPRPQPGNPKPRLFRIPADEAVINRMGFNNDGLEAFATRLERRLAKGRKAPGLVGANLGKNKDTVEAADDYALGVRRVAALADYLVVNVSSPNTPGLRALQGRDPLRALLGRVLDARAACKLANPPPVWLKIAPDLTGEDKADIAAVALESGIDGLIVSNTTISRPPEIPEPLRGETGGLSGKPLFALSTAVLGEMHRLTGGKLPLIGVGGVSTGADAYAKVRAGASLVQIYTAMIYHGPGLVHSICTELAALLRRDGFARLSDAVGADHR